jgi:hypothetical protein
MHIKKLAFSAFSLGLMILLTLGCKKKEEKISYNAPPTISFLQPETNLFIDNDTTITFIVDANDKDGTIEKVEFSINGMIAQTVTTQPYQFDWSISNTNSIGLYKIKATAYDNQDANAEAEIQLEKKSYLFKWTGTYQGLSDHWISYPTEVNGQWQYVTNHTYKNAVVTVTMSNQVSCLDIAISYDSAAAEISSGLNFSSSGNYFNQWGGGSGYGSLTIKFSGESITYNYYQKCGIPCSSGIDFIALTN